MSVPNHGTIHFEDFPHFFDDGPFEKDLPTTSAPKAGAKGGRKKTKEATNEKKVGNKRKSSKNDGCETTSATSLSTRDIQKTVKKMKMGHQCLKYEKLRTEVQNLRHDLDHLRYRYYSELLRQKMEEDAHSSPPGGEEEEKK